ncbi:MAG: methionyl-tRNA formyltransferase [Lachnospiraceae bacterium]|nr:methionyl-tRNA formyltransferase [Lachnospiraceae bacterium]
MKIVFMGTPDFAAMALEKLVSAGHEITLVVTQPDKEKGRGKQVQKSDVKLVAEKYDIPVFQPVKIKTEESVEILRGYEADIFVVAAFGQILSKEILDMPKYGCVNIHASLLPRLRGAAPIQWSIIDGDEKTGVTIQQMDVGLDTGDILAVKEVEIASDETGGSLFDKLAIAGADLIVETLPLIEAGKITPVPQDESLSTYAKKLSKDMGLIDWNMPAVAIERLIRGCSPWPSSYSNIGGKSLKIWKAAVTDTKATPGEVSEVTKESITIGCGEGSLVVEELQLEGKKRMSVHDFLLGYHINVGDKLGV